MGKTLAKQVVDPESGEVVAEAGTLIGPTLAFRLIALPLQYQFYKLNEQWIAPGIIATKGGEQMNAMLAHSLAETDTVYVVLQARLVGNKYLHVQGAGPNVNRDYGVAEDIWLNRMSQELRDWFRQWHTEKVHFRRTSLDEDSSERYARIHARLNGLRMHFQVHGSSLNRCYGTAFDIPNGILPDLYKFLCHLGSFPAPGSFPTPIEDGDIPF